MPMKNWPRKKSDANTPNNDWMKIARCGPVPTPAVPNPCPPMLDGWMEFTEDHNYSLN